MKLIPIRNRTTSLIELENNGPAKSGVGNPSILFASVLCLIGVLPAAGQGDQLPPSSAQSATTTVSQMEAPAARSLSPANPWMAAAPYPTTIARYAFAQNGEDLYIISGTVPWQCGQRREEVQRDDERLDIAG